MGRPTIRRVDLRVVATWLHRWVGLVLAVFLCVAGVTGSALVFYPELDEALDPVRASLDARDADAPHLEAWQLREALHRQAPSVRVIEMPLDLRADRAVVVFVRAAPGAPEPAHDEYFLDPVTGEVLGQRRWGQLTDGTTNLLPFLYRLHYSLALDDVGRFVLGVLALLWTLDCFVGAYLSFPAATRERARLLPRLRRWPSAWLLKTGKLASLVFSWHRASGLWLWAMLLVFAWSSVGFNLRPVYDPVMDAVRSYRDVGAELPELAAPEPEPALSWAQAQQRGEQLMDELARQQGFVVIEPRGLSYDERKGVFRYRVLSSRDASLRHPATLLWLDGVTGELVAFESPTGADSDAITTWLFALHWGEVAGWGWPYRVFAVVLGLALALLSASGVWIWWRKLRLRGHRRSRRLPLSP